MSPAAKGPRFGWVGKAESSSCCRNDELWRNVAPVFMQRVPAAQLAKGTEMPVDVNAAVSLNRRLFRAPLILAQLFSKRKCKNVGEPRSP